MKNAINSDHSLLELIQEFRCEAKTLIKQEFELAKTEMSEKMSRLKLNLAWLAVGGFVALGFQGLGLGIGMASFLGLAVAGFIAGLIGYGFVAKALAAISAESIVPEKTLQTLRELHGNNVPTGHSIRESVPEPTRSSAEVQSNVHATKSMLEETVEEIRERVAPRHITESLVAQIKEHPVRSGLIGLGTGLAGFLIVKARNGAAKH
jgi:hypothetical protein